MSPIRLLKSLYSSLHISQTQNWPGNLLELKRRRIEGNPKSLRPKSDLEKDFAVAVYLSEAPSPPKLLSRGGQANL